MCKKTNIYYDRNFNVVCDDSNEETYDLINGEFGCEEEIEYTEGVQEKLEDELELKNGTLDFLYDDDFREENFEEDYFKKFNYYKDLKI
jgi:hypothetical protein